VIRPRKVARGVELFPARTPTLPPATHTNSYALGDRDVLLVEPATPHEDERRAWLEWARGISSSGRNLVGIFLTHHHMDHVGGAEFFSTNLNLPLFAHADTAKRLPGLNVSQIIDETHVFDLGGAIPMRWRVLHTPGHAPGHLCLYDEDAGTAIVGDMVASEGTILIEPRDGDMQTYLLQLDRLASLSAHVALPAHGDPIDAPTALFRHYIAHRLARETKVLAAVEAGSESGSSIETLVPVAYADTSPMLWPIAALSLEAHLIKLQREGRVEKLVSGMYSRRMAS
jgi:ribonuclease/clavin/mitogillin